MILGRMDRYISFMSLLTMLGVGGCTVILILVFALAEESQSVSESRSFADVFLIVMFSLPRKLVEILPFVIFLGALIGLGTLSSNSELTVLRSAGISVFRLFGSAALASLVFYAVFTLICSDLAPRGEGIAAQISRSTAMVDANARQGSWLREGDVFTQIGSYARDGSIHNVTQYELSPVGNLTSARHAASGSYSPELNSWTLHKVRATNFNHGKASALSEDSQSWDVDFDPVSLSSRILVEPSKLGLVALYSHIVYLRQQGVNATSFQVAFWTKITEPLALLGLVLIATGIVVGPLREVGMGLRLTFGIAVGFTFKYINDLLTPIVVVYGFSPLIAAFLPIVLVWVAGWLLVRRSS